MFSFSIFYTEMNYIHIISAPLYNRKYIFNHYYWLNKISPVIITMYTMNTYNINLQASIPDDRGDNKSYNKNTLLKFIMKSDIYIFLLLIYFVSCNSKVYFVLKVFVILFTIIF